MRDGDEQAFVFADIRGFTSLTEAHGDERAADVVKHFGQHAAALLDRFGGEQVKTIGDAVMVRAGSAEAAVRFGIELAHHEMAQHDHPLVGVGIAWGSASARGGDWIGTSVNTAARLADLAGAGEVLLDAATREAAGELSGVTFREREAVPLRGLRHPVDIFEAWCEDADAALLVDPVCRMALAPGRSHERREHGGVTYHFCSRTCREAFEAEPDAFVGDVGRRHRR